ncbi:recombinase family protein [Kitasatospora sp. NPDC001309]|uniref:recombinase family protein n=1 Tax=Kitasatospora sp. NPDC001309 TaxID=3364013 RepID=UPI0036C1EC59
MTGKATDEGPYLDLLLRKSQVVRGTAVRDILSLKSQENQGRAWGRLNGYTIRRVFRENLSAYKTGVKRPEFEAAVHALLEGESDCLWVYDSSRYSRKGAGDVLKILDSPGKRLYFHLNGLDTEVPADRMRIVAEAEQAREYSRLLSEKVRDTKAIDRDAGKWLGTVPDGLKRTKKGKLKGSKRWPIIERIHDEAAMGRSQRLITLGLTADGYTAARGGPFRVSTVGKILRNPVYLGLQTVSVKGTPQIYLNGRGKPVRVLAKGFNGIPQATWDKHRRIAAGFERAEGFGAKHDEHVQPEQFPVAGLTWCAGGGFDLAKGHRANSVSHSFRCANIIAGIDCPSPVYIQRPGVLRVVLAEWKKRLTRQDPTDPTMLAVAERWVELQQPTESKAEADARAQIKIAEEAVARYDRLNAAGAYPGPSGEATFLKLRKAAVADVTTAQKGWEKIAQPLGDVSTLTDPERLDRLWTASSDTYRGQLLRLAIDAVFLKKAPASGGRITPDRVVIVWAKPRGWESPDGERGQLGANGP